jgi:hypothetical protein
MQRYRNRLAAERAIERHREERAATAAAAAYAAAAVHVDMTEVMQTDVRTLVRAFFLGAEMGDDDEQYPLSGPDGLLATLRCGPTEAQLRTVVGLLCDEGRLQRVGDGGQGGGGDRYRAVGGHVGSLRQLVFWFFAFGDDDIRSDNRQYYSVARLVEWGSMVGASGEEFRVAVNELEAIGYIYRTIDDQHFKVTAR